VEGFVVVVVGADIKSSGNEGEWRRQMTLRRENGKKPPTNGFEGGWFVEGCFMDGKQDI